MKSLLAYHLYHIIGFNFVYKSMSINIFKNTIVGVIVLIKSQVLLISFWHDYLVMILKKE